MQRLSIEEAERYLRNRKEKGFNVIQATLINHLPGVRQSSLAVANIDVMTKEYWEHCDQVIKIAEDLGIYMGILPTWGSIVQSNLLTVDNVEEYANFLAKRYADVPNIIWILGGDIRGSIQTEVHQKFGRLLKKLTPDKLIAYHPFGRTASSEWFHDEPWLDINMFQSGHRRYDQEFLGEWDDNANKEEVFGEDNWKYVRRDHSFENIKPTLDGEPSYEQLPQGLHNPSEPYWQAHDVRRYAYWSVFQGAAGHIYGHNAVQQCNIDDGSGNYGVKETWDMAIHHVGSSQLHHLKNLMASVDFQCGRPAEELLLSEQGEKYHRVAVFAGEDFIFCYSHLGNKFSIDLSPIKNKKMSAYWLDPISGVYSYLQDVTGMDLLEANSPNKYEGHNDWVLVIKESL